MGYTEIYNVKGTTTVTLNRPKVNALNEPFVDELKTVFGELRTDENTDTVILTGEGSFFSFGFDIPEFLDYKKEDFHEYVLKFSELVRDMFIFPSLSGIMRSFESFEARLSASSSESFSLIPTNTKNPFFISELSTLAFLTLWTTSLIGEDKSSGE